MIKTKQKTPVFFCPPVLFLYIVTGRQTDSCCSIRMDWLQPLRWTNGHPSHCHKFYQNFTHFHNFDSICTDFAVTWRKNLSRFWPGFKKTQFFLLYVESMLGGARKPFCLSVPRWHWQNGGACARLRCFPAVQVDVSRQDAISTRYLWTRD